VIAAAQVGDHSLALRSDGIVFAAGNNSYGRLGDGTTTNRSTFVQVQGISGVIALAAGYRSSAAIDSEGRVYCAGYNGSRELGDGTTLNRSTFVQVL
jgi:alpha-tubulin suppressor-like RCC1 family protein